MVFLVMELGRVCLIDREREVVRLMDHRVRHIVVESFQEGLRYPERAWVMELFLLLSSCPSSPIFLNVLVRILWNTWLLLLLLLLNEHDLLLQLLLIWRRSVFYILLRVVNHWLRRNLRQSFWSAWTSIGGRIKTIWRLELTHWGDLLDPVCVSKSLEVNCSTERRSGEVGGLVQYLLLFKLMRRLVSIIRSIEYIRV